MVEIQMAYQGNLRCQATHLQSGVSILTDAPKDNQGKGESFSPTDLVATALGTCMLTTMGIVARNIGVDFTGATVSVKKEMALAPRRIGQLTISFHLNVVADADQRQKLENAAMSCPVHKSLHPDVQTPVEFHWAPE